MSVLDKDNACNGTPNSCSQTSGSGHPSGSSSIASAESIHSRTDSKRLEQGWMWGWGSSEELQGASTSEEVQDSLKGSCEHSGILRNPARDLSRSWRARAAEAMSRNIQEARQESEAVFQNSAQGEGATLSFASNADSRMKQPRETTDCDTTRRLILFFLIQTFNVRLLKRCLPVCIQEFVFILPGILNGDFRHTDLRLVFCVSVHTR